MEALYPIVRRKRRPLMVVDVPPVVAGNGEPVQPAAAAESKEVVKDIEQNDGKSETDGGR